MINKNNNLVPNNTIAVIPLIDQEHTLTPERLENIFSKIDKTRDWFTEHFYRCLPLAIGNKYGFVLKSEYDITFEWNGGPNKEDITITTNEDVFNLYPIVSSHFGSGIVTINTPFMLRTPPGVNLMTINPPNYILPGITVMTGVVESDNLRHFFTFNLKLQIPNTKITINKGFPLAAVIPIPRYFVDSFNLVMAKDIFTDETIIEELQAEEDFFTLRTEIEPTLPNQRNRLYFNGVDIYGNKFDDHQKPRG
jgi:hypothetical protein